MQLLTIFPMLQYDFMRHAFLAAVLIAPLFALLGTMAVNNKMAFFSDALGHSAFTGIGLGVLLGMQEPLLAMLAFGIFLGLVITKVKSANMVSSDTVISVFSSAAMALGIVILSASGGFAKYSSYLIGDILTVGRKDLWTIGIVLVAAYVLWALLYNQLLLLSVNRSLAASRGVRVMLVENIFVIMVAVAVMVSIRWVGILMINSLLILPGGSGKKYYFLCRKLSLDCDCVWLAFFRCGLMGFLFLRHLCGGNDGADGGGTVLSYLSDWEKPKIKLKSGGKCGIFFWIREKEEERDACKI